MIPLTRLKDEYLEQDGVRFLKEIMMERSKEDGTVELVLGSAGANNRRSMIKVLREQLGTSDRVQQALAA